MSKVYSFRLSEGNPREIQAMEVMEVWVSQGYPLRYILTEALIRLGDNGDSLGGMEALLDQLAAMIEEFGNGKSRIESESSEKNHILSKNFIESVKKATKQGLRAG